MFFLNSTTLAELKKHQRLLQESISRIKLKLFAVKQHAKFRLSNGEVERLEAELETSQNQLAIVNSQIRGLTRAKRFRS